MKITGITIILEKIYGLMIILKTKPGFILKTFWYKFEMK